MNSKVRDLFRIETKDIVTLENFNQVYYVFEQMVQYDIDVPELEGLGERLPYALNKIATEKLERNDIITFFPIIWGKFEPYVRKLLYAIDKEGYALIQKDKNSSLVNVLEKIGIKVFVSENKRTKETDAIFTIYKLRNAEAHQCEAWSVRKCYDKLAKTMVAFLLVTNKVLPDIQKAMEELPVEKRINVPAVMKTALKVDIFDVRFKRNYFINLNGFFEGYRSIKDDLRNSVIDTQYDSDGWLQYIKSESDDYLSETFYVYEKREGRVVKCTQNGVLVHKNTGDREEEKKDFREYIYNDENNLVRVVVYRMKKRYNAFVKTEEFEVEYLTDGGIVVVQKSIGVKDRSGKNVGYEYEVLRETKWIFDAQWRLKKRITLSGVTEYIYDNDVLVSTKNPNNIVQIKRIGDNVFRIYDDTYNNKSRVLEKRLYQEDKLVRISKYKYIDDEENEVDDPILWEDICIAYDEK